MQNIKIDSIIRARLSRDLPALHSTDEEYDVIDRSMKAQRC